MSYVVPQDVLDLNSDIDFISGIVQYWQVGYLQSNDKYASAGDLSDFFNFPVGVGTVNEYTGDDGVTNDTGYAMSFVMQSSIMTHVVWEDSSGDIEFDTNMWICELDQVNPGYSYDWTPVMLEEEEPE